MIGEIESHREEFGGWVTARMRAGSIISALGRVVTSIVNADEA
jgi:hypothetical protein